MQMAFSVFSWWEDDYQTNNQNHCSTMIFVFLNHQLHPKLLTQNLRYLRVPDANHQPMLLCLPKVIGQRPFSQPSAIGPSSHASRRSARSMLTPALPFSTRDSVTYPVDAKFCSCLRDRQAKFRQNIFPQGFAGVLRVEHASHATPLGDQPIANSTLRPARAARVTSMSRLNFSHLPRTRSETRD